GTLLLNATAKSSIASAQENARAELAVLEGSYQNVLRDVSDPALSETTQRSLALYLFRQYVTSGSQFTLIRNGETLYSGSGYDVKQLLDGEAEKTVSIEGKRLFLAAGREYTAEDNTYQIFLLRDHSSVYESITALTWRFVFICVSAFLISAGVIMLCTFRALNPLKALQQSAASIAGGVYDRRIELSGTDEIAELATSFNKMADAVSMHVAAVTATAEEQKLLLAALTHELKTPMTSIIGYSETLQRTKLTRAQREEAVSYLHAECARLERLTQKMMRLITLSGGDEITLKRLPVRELFDRAEPTLRQAAARQGVLLQLRCGKEAFNMDADLMVSVLINLADNAIAANAGSIEIYANTSGIAVRDDGCGIPKALLGRVTQPFFRVDKARGRARGNAGLGLALVERIVKLHGAVLSIESEEGAGTSVSIRFPDLDS
ncbi:MAG TPA: HAMP domain-containing sensor histidine kinase, partial [Feifaniaceae bacterium]|nr:HAMP domain-containing sensor histidine kinase [Feifaniaceae bacterium]